jgi:hypothetical protein
MSANDPWRTLHSGSEPEDLLKVSAACLQKAKRVERANGDQFEAHHMCFTQRQLFEHLVSDGWIGYE